MFIWDFVANPIMDALMDWFYSQIVGFLGAFFAQMGNMGAELFELEWVQAVVLFFSQLGWALYGVSLVVSGFECGIEYISGRGNIQQAALNAIKGFLAVNLFTGAPGEVCPLGLTPTTSTTLMTVIGDILVVGAMEATHFDAHQYALRHHGGYLGTRSREQSQNK